MRNSVLCLLMLLVLATTAQTIVLDARVYLPGQAMRINYKTAGLDTDAWIGILPAEYTMDGLRSAYDYVNLGGIPSGLITLDTPGRCGNWAVCLFPNEDDMVVASAVCAFGVGALLTLSAKCFAPGDTINLEYEIAPSLLSPGSWIGIIPYTSSSLLKADDLASALDRRMLDDSPFGSLTFTAPEAGRWSFRLISGDAAATEIGGVSFEVR